ncbi:hypothetical protein PENTCL1PPCAC_28932 [Pristionchus entomophagus]|uniref:Uncharacterized protein n=1 Tax=Pristionchus entomophagus TaxID=358040 RepID=A0AAV5UKD4_9BILA|nr:hypothetical protein PENTCL1PPCAC_28932 [Pristionchus entomophagus]
MLRRNSSDLPILARSRREWAYSRRCFIIIAAQSADCLQVRSPDRPSQFQRAPHDVRASSSLSHLPWHRASADASREDNWKDSHRGRGRRRICRGRGRSRGGVHVINPIIERPSIDDPYHPQQRLSPSQDFMCLIASYRYTNHRYHAINDCVCSKLGYWSFIPRR